MSDVRCPMCGKPNPAEAEICQFCQARLKPFNLSSDAPAGSEPEVPSWLTSLRSSDQDQPESAGQSAPAPDWLTGLRSETSSEDEEAAGAEQADYSGVTDNADRQVPDWLKGILPEDERPAAPAGSSKAEARLLRGKRSRLVLKVEPGAQRAAPLRAGASARLAVGFR